MRLPRGAHPEPERRPGAERLYHCFGCEVGGDVFEFVQETAGLDFCEAIEFLTDRYGVPLGEHTPRTPPRPLRAAGPSVRTSCATAPRPFTSAYGP